MGTLGKPMRKWRVWVTETMVTEYKPVTIEGPTRQYAMGLAEGLAQHNHLDDDSQGSRYTSRIEPVSEEAWPPKGCPSPMLCQHEPKCREVRQLDSICPLGGGQTKVESVSQEQTS